MKITAPEYYKKFKCIADKCVHNCCIGWEIDIDEASYAAYKNHKGELKTRFETGVADDGDCPHFVQKKDGRCSFLSENNLCDIFIHMGEKSMCQVCTDHPRFRNFYSAAQEIGLGLCCEEAVRIVLSHDKKFNMYVVEDDKENIPLLPEETEFFDVRRQIFDILEDENLNLSEKFEEIASMAGTDTKTELFENLPYLFENLEYMETDVLALVEGTVDAPDDIITRFEHEFQNLAVYFVFRHFTDALDDGMYAQRLLFALLSVKAVATMCKKHLQLTKNFTPDDLFDFVRIYSTEIEYSDKNILDILDKITEKLI